VAEPREGEVVRASDEAQAREPHPYRNTEKDAG
jgi:hypothetical protein